MFTVNYIPPKEHTYKTVEIFEATFENNGKSYKAIINDGVLHGIYEYDPACEDFPPYSQFSAKNLPVKLVQSIIDLYYESRRK